jgi:hypothetical protein
MRRCGDCKQTPYSISPSTASRKSIEGETAINSVLNGKCIESRPAPNWDILGLANLTLLAKRQKYDRAKQKYVIDFNKLPLDDKKTFDLLTSGRRAAFQLKGEGMRRNIKELKPTNFSEDRCR